MSLFDGLRHRFYVLRRGEAYAAEVEREIRFHIELDALGQSAAGRAHRDAELAARRSLGNSTYVREEVRRMTTQLWIDRVVQDTTYALRGLRRSPGLTLAVVLTLGLGIGVNAAMFSLLDRVFLRPPAGVVDPGGVRRLYTELASGNSRLTWPTIEYPQYRAFRAAIAPSTTIGLFSSPESTSVRDGNGRITGRVSYVTSGFFSVLGVRAAAGRLITADEDPIETPTPVAVLSDAFWRRAFGGDRAVLGRRVAIKQRVFTVVGITAPAFTGIELSAADVWLPANSRDASAGYYGLAWYNSFGAPFKVIVRPSTPAAEQQILTAGTNAIRPVEMKGLWYDPNIRFRSGPIVAALGPAPQQTEMIVATRVAGIALMVLVIACANVTNLLLLRAVRRRREIAVRRALGVSRGRLLEQLTVESLVLSLAGGAIAALFATWAGIALRRLVLPSINWATSAVDLRTITFVVGVSVMLGLITGLTPALQAMKPDLVESLKAGMRDAAYRGSKLRASLLAVQAALCVVLLVGAGLFLRSLDNVESIGVGYDTENRIFIRPAFDDPRGHSMELATALPEAARRLRAIDGVEAVAYTSVPPLQGASFRRIFLPDRDSIPQLPNDYGPSMAAVSPAFFRASGLRLVAGREFTDADQRSSTPVSIVGESMARLYWPGETAIGKCIMVLKRDRCFIVVGVADDAHRRGIIEAPISQFYVPVAQGFDSPQDLIVLVRSGRGPAVTRAAEEILRPLVSEMVGVIARPFSSVLDRELRPWRLGASLFTALGILALVVAAIGVYSVVAYGVSQRVHEMGVRIALGAQMRNIIDLVLGDGLRIVAIGIAAGVVASLALGRFVASLLFGVVPGDPSILIAVVTLLCVVGAVACLIPAWRAARVDPVTALRAD